MLFKWARNGAKDLNAWDVQFALVDQDGNWVKNGNNNFTGRINPRVLP